MSYYTELVLLAKARKDKHKQIKAELENPHNYEAAGLAMFVALLEMRDSGSLCFKSKGHPFWSDYDVDDEDGLLDALNAPWCDPDEIASWLAQFVTPDSRILYHSLELDGLDFAFEFDGNGKFRYLEYRPVQNWKKPLLLAVAPPPVQKSKTRQKRLKDAKASLKMIKETQ